MPNSHSEEEEVDRYSSNLNQFKTLDSTLQTFPSSTLNPTRTSALQTYFQNNQYSCRSMMIAHNRQYSELSDSAPQNKKQLYALQRWINMYYKQYQQSQEQRTVIEQLIEQQKRLNSRKIRQIKELTETIKKDTQMKTKLKNKIKSQNRRQLLSIETDIQSTKERMDFLIDEIEELKKRASISKGKIRRKSAQPKITYIVTHPPPSLSPYPQNFCLKSNKDSQQTSRMFPYRNKKCKMPKHKISISQLLINKGVNPRDQQIQSFCQSLNESRNSEKTRKSKVFSGGWEKNEEQKELLEELQKSSGTKVKYSEKTKNIEQQQQKQLEVASKQQKKSIRKKTNENLKESAIYIDTGFADDSYSKSQYSDEKISKQVSENPLEQKHSYSEIIKKSKNKNANSHKQAEKHVPHEISTPTPIYLQNLKKSSPSFQKGNAEDDDDDFDFENINLLAVSKISKQREFSEGKKTIQRQEEGLKDQKSSIIHKSNNNYSFKKNNLKQMHEIREIDEVQIDDSREQIQRKRKLSGSRYSLIHKS